LKKEKGEIIVNTKEKVEVAFDVYKKNAGEIIMKHPFPLLEQIFSEAITKLEKNLPLLDEEIKRHIMLSIKQLKKMVLQGIVKKAVQLGEANPEELKKYPRAFAFFEEVKKDKPDWNNFFEEFNKKH